MTCHHAPVFSYPIVNDMVDCDQKMVVESILFFLDILWLRLVWFQILSLLHSLLDTFGIAELDKIKQLFQPYYSLFTLQKPQSLLRINGERGFLRMN